MIKSLVMAIATRGLCLLATAVLAIVFASATGDPAGLLLDPRADLAQHDALRSALALDRPLMERMTTNLAAILSGDLGTSWQSGQSVAHLITEAAPASVDLATAAMLCALALAMPLAIAAALRPASRLAATIRTISMATAGLPTFAIAILLTGLFSASMGLMPAFGRGATVNVLGWETGLLTVSGLHGLILPVLTVALALAGLFIRTIERALQTVMHQDYIAAARARGVGSWSLLLQHGLANAAPPIVATATIQLGNLVPFAIVTEMVFQRPGLGLVFFRAVEHADIPVITALLILAGVVFAVCGILSDLILSRIDPRLRNPEQRCP